MNELRQFALLTSLELEQINNSKLKSSIERIRDPKTDALEKEVFSKLAQFSVGNEPSAPKSNKHLPSDNKTLSPEEAMKELEEMQAKGLI
jgi:hypothetical protein